MNAAVKASRAYPLQLWLPGEYPNCVTADYVPGSSPPAYTIDGEPCAIDVQIPADLLAAGWCWHGATLRWSETPESCGIAIVTSAYPPPGWPSTRGSCFDCAREFERLRSESEQRRIAERVAKATKTKLPKKDAPAPEAVQLELF